MGVCNNLLLTIVLQQEHYANLAQLVEHFIRNERVVGSNPIVGSVVSFWGDAGVTLATSMAERSLKQYHLLGFRI